MPIWEAPANKMLAVLIAAVAAHYLPELVLQDIAVREIAEKANLILIVNLLHAALSTIAVIIFPATVPLASIISTIAVNIFSAAVLLFSMLVLEPAMA